MDFTIRDYQPADFKEINQLWMTTGLGNPERGDDENTIAHTLKNGGKFLVMEINPDKEIIGTSWITNDGRRLYLHHFGIKPEYQGQKLSIPLLNASLDYVKKLNMQIKLEVHQDSKIAAALYKKTGFKPLGNYHVYIIRELNEIKTLNR